MTSTNAPKKRSNRSRTHDLTVLVKLNRVTAPKQTRTEQRLQAIVQALESLLDGRPFSEITIPDIAERAGCGTASIYARFQDKRSILVALHESLRDRQMAEIDQATSPKLHVRLSFEQTALSVCRSIVSYYAENRNLLRASYLLDDEEVYARHASVVRYASEKIAALLSQKLDAQIVAKASLNKRFELATNAIFALMQQQMVFAIHPSPRASAAKSSALAAELAVLLGLILTSDV